MLVHNSYTRRGTEELHTGIKNGTIIPETPHDFALQSLTRSQLNEFFVDLGIAVGTQVDNRIKLVRAWWVVYDANLRTVVPNLESVSRFLSTRNIDPAIFRNEVSSLGDFQDDFIRSLDNATGTTPFPRLINRETPDTDGALLGRFENGAFVRDPASNAQVTGTWDYIVKQDGEIVVGRKHSWLSDGGEDVLAAGELKWNNGTLVDINNSSGHYRPTPGEGFNFLRFFRNQEVDVNNAWLTLRVENGSSSYPIFKQISPNGVARILYE